MTARQLSQHQAQGIRDPLGPSARRTPEPGFKSDPRQKRCGDLVVVEGQIGGDAGLLPRVAHQLHPGMPPRAVQVRDQCMPGGKAQGLPLEPVGHDEIADKGQNTALVEIDPAGRCFALVRIGEQHPRPPLLRTVRETALPHQARDVRQVACVNDPDLVSRHRALLNGARRYL